MENNSCIICRNETLELRKCHTCSAYYCFDCMLQYIAEYIKKKTTYKNFKCCQCNSYLGLKNSSDTVVNLSEVSQADTFHVIVPHRIINVPIFGELCLYGSEITGLWYTTNRITANVLRHNICNTNLIDMTPDNMICDFNGLYDDIVTVHINYNELENTVMLNSWFNTTGCHITIFENVLANMVYLINLKLKLNWDTQRWEVTTYIKKATEYNGFYCNICRSRISKRNTPTDLKDVNEVPNYKRHMDGTVHKMAVYKKQLKADKKKSTNVE